jgi:hypothetical protein
MSILETPRVESLDVAAPPYTTLRIVTGRGFLGNLVPSLTRRTYRIVLDISALRLVQNAINKDLAVVNNWMDLSMTDLAVIVWAGLQRFHAKEKLSREQVEQWLAPAQHSPLWIMLFDQCFPGYREALQKMKEHLDKTGTHADPKQAAPNASV